MQVTSNRHVPEESQADGEEHTTTGDTNALPEFPWTLAGQEVLDALDTSGEGLSADDVRRRQQRYGPNRLRRIQRKSAWQILWEQIKSLIMGLLVAAMIVSLLFGQTVDAIAIAAVIIVNTAIGFFTEWRAVQSMEALQKLGDVHTRVRRGGSEQRITADDLVPGDVVVLEGGDVIAADLRLLDVTDLEADESALTGESMPVAKQTEPLDRDTELAERTCMTYKGTAVTRGSGTGVVVATGMQTELGQISSMVETTAGDGTPLEKQLGRLGRRLVWMTLGVAAVVIVAGVLAGRALYLMVEIGIALAVAAIPEGLPIVATVALAHGMWRMLRRNALIRKLSSVETLGATTLICTDKTGTLTENRMTARMLVLPNAVVQVPEQESPSFQIDGDAASPDEHPALRQALEVAVLCNDAVLHDDAQDDGESHEGDPLEVALLQMGRRAGRTQRDLLDARPKVRDEAFNRKTNMMATFHQADDGFFVAVKGAPEAVLDACTHQVGPDGKEPMDDAARRHWQEEYEALAEDGLRVLTLACKTVPDREAAPYDDLCFLAHVGLLDPPRRDVRAVIEHCKRAGIHVVMVTGDHPATARKVAQAVGLDDDEDRVIRGQDFVKPDEASEEQLQRFQRATVFARVTPEQKLDLIDLHRNNGEIVAMTGDGVNDAPALRNAHIGVAMGRRGTDVAKEAADMVLQDDAFSTIVAAVEQGRVIFDNIRKFVVYLLSGNVGEILAVGAAAVAGLPMPLLPLQILYINLLNDVFPALALGMGGSTRRVMEQPPRHPEEAVITRAGWSAVAGYGLLIAATVLGVFAYALFGLELGHTQAVTISFLTLSITRLVHVFNMRRPDSGFFKNEITRNPYVWGALVLCVGLLLLAVYVPFLADLLSVSPPGLHDLLLIGGASLVPLLAGQGYLLIRSRSNAEERAET